MSAPVGAIKLDVKAYSGKSYNDIVNGELKHVLQALVTLRETGVWNEIVYLVIPRLNDSDAEFLGVWT